MRLRRNRSIAWIAAIAVLLQALWPLLAHARPKDPALLMPVCTIDGVTHYLEIKAGKTPLEERSATHGEHCKLCVFGDGKSVAFFTPDFLSFVLDGVSSQVSEKPQASVLQATRHCAHPRAPPAVS